MRGLDLLLALYARHLDVFRRGPGLRFGITLFRFVDDDPFELSFFIKEIGDVKERVAFQTDIDKGGLHARQDAHYATLVDIADDTLVLLAALDIKLGDSFIFDDRNLL